MASIENYEGDHSLSDRELFDKIGGTMAVNITIDPFFERILADKILSPYFKGGYLDNQIGTRKMFLTFLFGGFSRVEMANIREVHRPMVENKNLSDIHFDTMISHLRDTLLCAGIDSDLVNTVIKRAETTRNDVLCR